MGIDFRDKEYSLKITNTQPSLPLIKENCAKTQEKLIEVLTNGRHATELGLTT